MNEAEIARAVALKLSATESSVDVAIAETCRLIEGLMTARADLRLSTTLGGRSGERLATTLSALMAARGEIGAAHAALREAQASLGLGEHDFSVDACGPLDKPPPPSGRLGLDEPAGKSAQAPPLRRA